MKLKVKEKVYQDWKSKNTDPYSAGIFTYAERWSDLMEKHMEKGTSLKTCVDADSHTADVDGITGFMYGAAVSILSKCWKHGEELRVWHNLKTQLGDEGERANKSKGVLNPALITIR